MQSVSLFYHVYGAQMDFNTKDAFYDNQIMGKNEHGEKCPSEQYREVTFWLGVDGED